MSQRRQRFTGFLESPWAVWSVLALALVVRLIKLGSRDFWQDEAHLFFQTDELLPYLRGDLLSNHPPLLSLMLWVWRQLGLAGSEFSVRLLTVLIGLGAVWGMYAFGKRLFGARAGLAAAFLLAISPFHLYHSQDFKAYILLPTTGLFAALYLYRGAVGGRARDWFLYGLWAVLACYSDAFAAPLMIALNGWFIWWWAARGRRAEQAGFGPIKGWLASNVCAFVLSIPVILLFIAPVNRILVQSSEWWIKEPDLWSVAFYLKTVAFGYADFEPWFQIALAFWLVLIASGVWLGLRRNRWAARLLLVWAIVPAAMVFALSHVTESVFLIRALLPFSMPLYLLAALPLSGARPAWLRPAAAVAVAACAAPSLYARYTDYLAPSEWPHRPGLHEPRQTHAATEYVLKHWREGDVLLHGGVNTWLPMHLYGMRGKDHVSVAHGPEFFKQFYSGNPPNTKREEFLAFFPREVQVLTRGRDRVWYVFVDWERYYLEQNPLTVWRWLNAHYAEVRRARFKGLEAYLFTSRLDGEPVKAVERDVDTGASAEMRYRAGGARYAYRQIRPDTGLTPAPPEDRRGRLTLRFAPTGTDGERVPLAKGSGIARSAPVELRNVTDEPVTADVIALASDRLIEGASFLQSEPESGHWNVSALYNTEPPPSEYEEVAMMTGRVRAQTPPLVRRFFLPPAPAPYRSLWLLNGCPGDLESRRALLSAPAKTPRGVTDLAAALPRGLTGLHRLGWFAGGSVEGGDIELTVTARAPTESGPPFWTNLAAVAFVAAPVEEGRRPRVLAPVPGRVRLAPGQTATWTFETDRPRLDVWVFEKEEGGKGYHIFRIAGSGKTAPDH